jgi:hypothetical protein
MELIEKFLLSNNTEQDLGIVNYQDRKLLYQLCHQNNLHTLSISTGDYNSNNEPIKKFIISRNPFPIFDQGLLTSITNEIKLSLDVRQDISLQDIISLSEKNKIIIERFLYQFSFYYSNDYSRLFVHRKDITNKIKKELNQITIPDHKYDIKHKKPNFFKLENCNQTFVRFDMINAVTAVIGIRNWEQYMSTFTNIDLYKTSKSLRGLIMKDIHSKCMLLVSDHVHEFVERIPYNLKQPYLYVNNDEVIIIYDKEANHEELMNVIDPNKYFRMQIFQLLYQENDKHSWFIDIHDNGTKKIKAKQQKSNKK